MSVNWKETKQKLSKSLMKTITALNSFLMQNRES